MKVKVCGMLAPDNLEEVCALEPDYVGYIFFSGSKRYVGESPDHKLFRVPGPGISKVGVFVNEDIDRVQKIVDLRQLNLVQLHGEESADYCRTLSRQGIRVIKAMDAARDAEQLEAYREHVEFFLFDTPGKGYGGTGRKFDWNLLDKLASTHRFLLGGGIGAGDVEKVLEVQHEGMLGVDLNSRFEVSPGIKDVKLLKEFMQQIIKK